MIKAPLERTLILDCAHALLVECGFGRLRMAALLRQSGLDAGDVRRNFPDMAAVERAVLRRQLDADEWSHDRAWERARDLVSDPLAVCVSALGLLAAEQAPGSSPGWALAAACRQQCPDDPALRALAEEGARRLRARLFAAFAEVAAVHPPRPGLSPPALALIAASLLEAPPAPPPAEDEASARIECLRTLVKLAYESHEGGSSA